MRRIWVLVPLTREVGIDWMLEALGGLGGAIRVTESMAGGGDGSVVGGGGIVGCERRGGAVTGGTVRKALGVLIDAMLGERGAGGIFGAIIDCRGGTGDGDAGRTYRLQRASNPSGPWTTFAALTARPNGAVEHLDSTPLDSAFYRVAAP